MKFGGGDNTNSGSLITGFYRWQERTQLSQCCSTKFMISFSVNCATFNEIRFDIFSHTQKTSFYE